MQELYLIFSRFFIVQAFGKADRIPFLIGLVQSCSAPFLQTKSRRNATKTNLSFPPNKVWQGHRVQKLIS